MERVLDTEDTLKDFKISPNGSIGDSLEIQAGRAMLYINPTTYTTALTNHEAKSIIVYSSALTGLTTSLIAAGVALSLTSF